MPTHRSNTKVGVYVDVPNTYRNGGHKMQYDVLREFAARDDSEPVRLNAYITYDAERALEEPEYRLKATGFHAALRDLGYKVIVKRIQRYQDEMGNWITKSNADLELAVDALLQSQNLDRVVLVTGDGDFVRVVSALQNRGVRVEVIALDNIADELREEADYFISGYLVPKLVPTRNDRDEEWGEIGSRARGWCYWYNAQQAYGFFRYLREIAPGLWLTDTRHPHSPFGTVFFHSSDLPFGVDPDRLPSRNLIFEFEITESDRGKQNQATDIILTSRL